MKQPICGRIDCNNVGVEFLLGQFICKEHYDEIVELSRAKKPMMEIYKDLVKKEELFDIRRKKNE